MATVAERYRGAIKKIILDYAEEQPTTDEVTTEVVMDDERGHYEVLAVGWQGNKRIHHSIIHIDLHGDKVWLQQDATDRVIADELVKAGIPPYALVLGFRHPRVREYSGFAVT